MSGGDGEDAAKVIPTLWIPFVYTDIDPNPLDPFTLVTLQQYVAAFFSGLELRDMVVPAMPVAPAGMLALSERVNRVLKTRQGRLGRSLAERQVKVGDLFTCMERLPDLGKKFGCDVSGSIAMLALTRRELFTDDDGLLPEAPVPLQQIGHARYCHSSVRRKVGCISLAHLGYPGGQTKDMAYQKFLRRILKVVTHQILKILGLQMCPSYRCLCYRFKPFDPEGETPLMLCDVCESKLAETMADLRYQAAKLGKNEREASKVRREDPLMLARLRYQKLLEVFDEVNGRVQKIRIGYRHYQEFERECDWLHLADQILQETPSWFIKKRGLPEIVACAHEKQNSRALHRTFSDPLLTRNCVVDMEQSGPYRHDMGLLDKWNEKVINRKFSTGGRYVEMGGSLRPKKVGLFRDKEERRNLGINAQMIRRDASALF